MWLKITFRFNNERMADVPGINQLGKWGRQTLKSSVHLSSGPQRQWCWRADPHRAPIWSLPPPPWDSIQGKLLVWRTTHNGEYIYSILNVIRRSEMIASLICVWLKSIYLECLLDSVFIVVFFEQNLWYNCRSFRCFLGDLNMLLKPNFDKYFWRFQSSSF